MKQWREFKTYQELMKSKPDQSSNVKRSDAAQLTRDEPVVPTPEDNADISYYDTAFSGVTTYLPTVMDTGASSHMFGDKGVFSSIHPTSPSHIGVASKGGSIRSTF